MYFAAILGGAAIGGIGAYAVSRSSQRADPASPTAPNKTNRSSYEALSVKPPADSRYHRTRNLYGDSRTSKPLRMKGKKYRPY